MTSIALAAWDWPAFAGGGAASLLHTAAVGLVERGARVTVWTRGGGDRDAALAGAAPIGGVTVVGLPGRSWRQRGTRHWERGVADALDRSVPDGVIVGSLDALPGVVAAVDGRAPVACIAHGRDVTGRRSWGHRSLRRRALGLPGVTWLTLTRWLADELVARGIPQDRTRVVPAAVAAAVPGPPATDAVRWSEGHQEAAVPRLLVLGRLIPRKGHALLLDAWPRLRAAHPGVELDIVGGGPLAGELRGRAADMPGVHVLGHLPAPDLEARWRSADLLVLPCHEGPDGDTEGYGLVFLEAAARGLASVGGATAGAAEAIAQVGGFPIRAPLDPHDIARTILSALADPEALRRRALAARRTWEAAHRPHHLGEALLAAVGLSAEAA